MSLEVLSGRSTCQINATKNESERESWWLDQPHLTADKTLRARSQKSQDSALRLVARLSLPSQSHRETRVGSTWNKVGKVCVWISLCVYVWVCICVCKCLSSVYLVCVCVSENVCLFLCVCVWVCVYVCMWKCLSCVYLVCVSLCVLCVIWNSSRYKHFNYTKLTSRARDAECLPRAWSLALILRYHIRQVRRHKPVILLRRRQKQPGQNPRVILSYIKTLRAA